MSKSDSPRRLGAIVRSWFDNQSALANIAPEQASSKPALYRLLPIIAVHITCLAVFWVGVSPIAVLTCLGLYLLRMFAITGFYHRYFSHRAFRTSRLMQFIFAAIGSMSAQRGPLWWAAHHRDHHRHADTPADLHSPGQHGFFQSHMGWFLSDRGYLTPPKRVEDWRRFPELVWLDRFDLVMPVVLAVLMLGWGALLNALFPGLGTGPWQMLIWGFFVSTVVLFHATVSINSLAHRFGKRRYDTPDDSRNNFWLALITLGEGWHNNHHHFPGSARQGFRRFEIDFTYYGLWLMSKLGLVWDLKPVPARIQRARLIKPER